MSTFTELHPYHVIRLAASSSQILCCKNASLQTYPSFKECPSIGLCDGFKELAFGQLILTN